MRLPRPELTWPAHAESCAPPIPSRGIIADCRVRADRPPPALHEQRSDDQIALGTAVGARTSVSACAQHPGLRDLNDVGHDHSLHLAFTDALHASLRSPREGVVNDSWPL